MSGGNWFRSNGAIVEKDLSPKHKKRRLEAAMRNKAAEQRRFYGCKIVTEWERWARLSIIDDYILK